MLRYFCAIAGVVFAAGLLAASTFGEDAYPQGGGADPDSVTYQQNVNSTRFQFATGIDKTEIAGIKSADYADFYKKWKLVTVTYRRDVNEVRFSYANDLAYQTLRKHSTDYPDGAAFGKIPMVADGDPAFINSVAPIVALRYQFMVRDKKKYADTDGWGYAVFDLGGKLVADRPYTDMKTYSAQCVECHKLVKDRNYVFSRFPAFNFEEWKQHTAVPEQGVRLDFADRDVKTLPPNVQLLIPKAFQQVKLLVGDIGLGMFTGTAYELRPSLIVEALRSKMPAVLASDDGKIISLVAPADPVQEPTALPCPAGKSLFVSYWTVGLNPDNGPSKDLFCLEVK